MTKPEDSTAVAIHDPESRPPGVEPWTAGGIARDYWRVATLGLLVGLFAYIGSFIVPPTYAASSRILIRGRDTTVLNSNGESLADQSGVIDSQLAVTLTDTQAALLGNRAIAERIVDDLDLDVVEEEKSGPIASLRRGFVGTYKWTRAMLAHGFYKKVDARTAAIDRVQAGLGAKQVDEGFVLDVGALYDDPDKAAAIANLAADLLVDSTDQRFRTESAAYRDFLDTRVDEATAEEQTARAALSDYKAANGIVTTPQEDAQLLLESEDDLAGEVRSTQASLAAARARVTSLSRALAATSPMATTNQNIETGRSETDIATSGQNAAYTQLLAELQTAQADAAALSARLGAVEGALEQSTGAAPGTLSGEEAELARRQLDVAIASDTRAQLAVELQTATVNAERSVVEITRVGSAAAPTYPIAPKRYLFLAAGLFIGSLAGFVWSFLRVQRRARRRALDAPTGMLDIRSPGDAAPVNSEVARDNGAVGVSARGSTATDPFP